MSFKSPELIITGKIVKVTTASQNQQCSYYVKARFFEGEEWNLLSGKNQFQTFQSEAINGVAPLEQPFTLEYLTTNIRGWPRLLVQVWRVDQYGRHNIFGYGTAGMPMGSGSYVLQIPCWRPMGSWYDIFIGANSELHHADIVCSSLSRYGLRTFSGSLVHMQVNIIGRNFHLHGVIR